LWIPPPRLRASKKPIELFPDLADLGADRATKPRENHFPGFNEQLPLPA
jgi:hypothetical protein